jgi:hypothetical protein
MNLVTPPSSSEVKNAWNYTSTPLYVFMEWYLNTALNLLLDLDV